MPIGSIIMYIDTVAPTNFLYCNGQTVSRTTYSSLYALIGIKYGQGDGSTTFHLPDFRGVFPRGWNDNATGPFSDPDASTRGRKYTGGNTNNLVGSYQQDAFASHSHSIAFKNTNSGDSVQLNDSAGTGTSDGTLSTNTTGGNETRPVNLYVVFYIKYQ